MQLFSRRKSREVQSFVLKLLNTNCPKLAARQEEARLDRRVNLVVVVTIIPFDGGCPQVRQGFTAMTREFSNTGVGVVLDHPRYIEHAILGFRFEGEMTFLRAEAKHLQPMGGGFYHLGFHLLEVVSLSEYPQLESLDF
jgi:hypothetical protein